MYKEHMYVCINIIYMYVCTYLGKSSLLSTHALDCRYVAPFQNQSLSRLRG